MILSFCEGERPPAGAEGWRAARDGWGEPAGPTFSRDKPEHGTGFDCAPLDPLEDLQRTPKAKAEAVRDALLRPTNQSII